MNRRYDVFDFIMVVGFVLIVVAIGIALLIQAADNSEALAIAGVWVIASFCLSVYLHGILQGVSRLEIKVPKRLAVLAFGISGILFVSAWMVNGT
ncbi:hypothetical protein QVZ43_10460 [Marinobacter sp. chi1]|uniref:Uncharacterized protein n=1 Tax=Marinobacter suaedae TaxID=3057675 RepID=A0ABT8W1N6_9GAMM|nr:hypothetical protein [Marinobacter sp. chi1]MDO3722144.1 hypothetical protein [Marinobacter sp. chi1]